MIVAIDPGKNHCGYAWRSSSGAFGCGYLAGLAVGIASALDECACECVVSVVVLERMAHAHGREGSIPGDLIDVTHTGALIAGWLRPDRLVTPTASEWKGSVPKRVHHPRILAALAPTLDERATRETAETFARLGKKKSEHVIDAIGLLLWIEGR